MATQPHSSTDLATDAAVIATDHRRHRTNHVRIRICEGRPSLSTPFLIESTLLTNAGTGLYLALMDRMRYCSQDEPRRHLWVSAPHRSRPVGLFLVDFSGLMWYLVFVRDGIIGVGQWQKPITTR